MKSRISRRSGRLFRASRFRVFRKVETLPCKSFDAVFDAVNSGKCEVGVDPD